MMCDVHFDAHDARGGSDETGTGLHVNWTAAAGPRVPAAFQVDGAKIEFSNAHNKSTCEMNKRAGRMHTEWRHN
jgi:hypothetical protein